MKYFWKLLCRAGSIVLGILTSIFSAISVNIFLTDIVREYLWNNKPLQSNSSKIILLGFICLSFLLILWYLVYLNIILSSSERLFAKIESKSSEKKDDWIFINSYNRARSKIICFVIYILIFMFAALSISYIVR
jgi:hypothetical protein